MPPWGDCSAPTAYAATQTTNTAIDTYWQAAARPTNVWNTSWYPKMDGTGSGHRQW